MKLTQFHTITFLQYMPDKLEEGVLYISEEFGCSQHLCACGCGDKINVKFHGLLLTAPAHHILINTVSLCSVDENYRIITNCTNPQSIPLFLIAYDTGNGEAEIVTDGEAYIITKSITWETPIPTKKQVSEAIEQYLQDTQI